MRHQPTEVPAQLLGRQLPWVSERQVSARTAAQNLTAHDQSIDSGLVEAYTGRVSLDMSVCRLRYVPELGVLLVASVGLAAQPTSHSNLGECLLCGFSAPGDVVGATQGVLYDTGEL